MAHRVVVCGSRDWADAKSIRERLSQLPKFSTVIQGECRGADLLAKEAAQKLGYDVIGIPANWAGRGAAAGPYRNRLMLNLLELMSGEKLVIAFHDDPEKSKGTKDCVNEAKRRGLRVEIIRSRKQ